MINLWSLTLFVQYTIGFVDMLKEFEVVKKENRDFKQPRFKVYYTKVSTICGLCLFWADIINGLL